MMYRLNVLAPVVALAGLCLFAPCSSAEDSTHVATPPSGASASTAPAPPAAAFPAKEPAATSAEAAPQPEATAAEEPLQPAERAPAPPSPPDVAPNSDKQEKLLTFNFRYQPWADVLDWFAEQGGYSLVLDSPPKGTFNYRDDRRYTAAEAIDLLNSVLLTKGYTLVIRDRMLMLVDLENEIPPSLVTRVSADELDKRGKYELVSTRFELKNLSADEAQKEVEKLLGPEGRVVVLPKAQQIVVTETGGRLREIRDVLQRADAARDPAQQEVRWFELRSVGPDEAMAMLRQVFEIPEGATATADGSLRMAADPIGLRLLVSGSPQRLAQVAKILKTVDEVPGGEERVEPGQQAALQLEVYDVAPADPESVLKVAQTLMADAPGVRLATDPKTGNLIALARPKEQATIKATIDQIRRDAQSVEVIQLRAIDPQLAVLAIGKLFGKDATQAPSIDADLANRQLLIRGSAGQIAQIRVLLEKMGESFGASPTLAGGKLRLVPVRGDTQQLIERVREFWPVLGKNELRVVPMRRSPGRGPGGNRSPREGPIDERTPVPSAAPEPAAPVLPDTRTETTWLDESADSPQPGRARVMLAAAGADRVDDKEPGAASQASPSDAAGPPILVLSTPEGLYLSSEDVEALNELQKLIDTLQGGSASGEAKLTVFYLRNAEAKNVADRLREILASAAPAATAPIGGAGSSTPAGSTGILGSLGTAGTLGRITPSGPISITPDTRLNALLVQAAPADVDLIEEILKILDRGDTEDVPAQPRPRLIPVVHTAASDIAKVVKDVYQTRMAGNNSGNQGNRNDSPREMMMRMFRGGGGGDSSNTSSNRDAQTKMTIGVDERTNSLVVSAPEPLFKEVEDLVAALDGAASQDEETVEVVTLRESNPETVRAALASLLGDAVQTSTTSTSTNRQRSPGFTGGWPGFGGFPSFMRGSGTPGSFQGGFRGPSFGGFPFGGGFSRGDRGDRGGRGDRSSRGDRGDRGGRGNR